MVIGFTWLLLLMGSIYDIKYKALPWWFLAGGAVAALVLAVVLRPVELWKMVGGLVLGMLLFGISFLTGGALGKGDGIIIGIIGLNLGFPIVFSVFSGALLLAAVLSIVLIIFKKVNRKTTLPFLPFLGVAYGFFCIGSFL